MTRIIAFLILLTLAAGYAHALGVGGEGLRFGRVGATAGKATAAPAGNFLLSNAGSVLLVNTGVKFLVQ